MFDSIFILSISSEIDGVRSEQPNRERGKTKHGLLTFANVPEYSRCREFVFEAEKIW